MLLLAWEVGGYLVPPIFLSPLHASLIAFYRMVLDGTLIAATLSTLTALLFGLAIALASGVLIGFAMGRYRPVQWVLEPYVNGLYSTPTIAVLPMVTLWLGLYMAPKVALVVLIAIFPILKNTFTGVLNVSEEYLEPAKSMGITEVQLFYKVMVPATLPYIMAGLRLSVGRGVVGVVVGEFFTVQTGLGGMVVTFAGKFKTADMFVPIIVLVTIGVGLTEFIKFLQEHLAPWKESERDQGM